MTDAEIKAEAVKWLEQRFARQKAMDEEWDRRNRRFLRIYFIAVPIWVLIVFFSLRIMWRR